MDDKELSNIISAILAYAHETCTGDGCWGVFGYERRPKRGLLAGLFKNDEQKKTEDFILREVFTIILASYLKRAAEPEAYTAALADAFAGDSAALSYFGMKKSAGQEARTRFLDVLGEYLKSDNVAATMIMRYEEEFGHLVTESIRDGSVRTAIMMEFLPETWIR